MRGGTGSTTFNLVNPKGNFCFKVRILYQRNFTVQRANENQGDEWAE